MHLLAVPYRVRTPHQAGLVGVLANAELTLGIRFPRLSLGPATVQACGFCSQSLYVLDFDCSPCIARYRQYTGDPTDDCKQWFYPPGGSCWGCTNANNPRAHHFDVVHLGSGSVEGFERDSIGEGIRERTLTTTWGLTPFAVTSAGAGQGPESHSAPLSHPTGEMGGET